MSPDAHDSGTGRGGLFQSIKGLTSTLLGIIQTRLDLLSTEFEEERIRLISMLVWTCVGLFCALIGVVFVTLLVVVALWDNHRLLALGIPAMLFLLGAALSVWVVAAKARAKPRLFAASLAELAKDRARLSSHL